MSATSTLLLRRLEQACDVKCEVTNAWSAEYENKGLVTQLLVRNPGLGREKAYLKLLSATGGLRAERDDFVFTVFGIGKKFPSVRRHHGARTGWFRFGNLLRLSTGRTVDLAFNLRFRNHFVYEANATGSSFIRVASSLQEFTHRLCDNRLEQEVMRGSPAARP